MDALEIRARCVCFSTNSLGSFQTQCVVQRQINVVADFGWTPSRCVVAKFLVYRHLGRFMLVANSLTASQTYGGPIYVSWYGNWQIIVIQDVHDAVELSHSKVGSSSSLWACDSMFVSGIPFCETSVRRSSFVSHPKRQAIVITDVGRRSRFASLSVSQFMVVSDTEQTLSLCVIFFLTM